MALRAPSASRHPSSPYFLLLQLLKMTLFSHLSLLRSGHGSAHPNVTCYANDLASLRSIASSFPSGNFSDWDATEDDCCAWRGDSITCSEPVLVGDVFTRRVTNLSLDAQVRNLSFRPIPPSVCSLSALVTLSLVAASLANGHDDRITSDYTGFTGSIPACIGSNLTHLVELGLSGNSLTGSIPPSFSRLHELVSLDLASNQLSGTLLASSLPSSALSYLYLHENAFSGPIPSFYRFPHLIILDLSSNSFSGSVSSLFSSPLPSLTILDLSSNSLSGEIPSFHPSSFSALEFLILDDNLLNGSLPPSLCSLRHLQVLRLSFNALSGNLSELCKDLRPKFTQITVLALSHNQFVGDFPEWIGSLESLSRLDLSFNSFKGSLPDTWRSLGRSSGIPFYLDLSGNSLLAPSSYVCWGIGAHKLAKLWLWRLMERERRSARLEKREK